MVRGGGTDAADSAMTPPTPPDLARASLRRLATPHAIDFGTRLLQHGRNGVISFREFVAVARAFVAEQPEASAVYLATLVALDIGRGDDDETRKPPPPSAN
jgi:hypothetical protein